MNDLVDTIMNIEVFLFIGVLVWLYFKPVNKDNDSSD
jgi:hypothetical protein